MEIAVAILVILGVIIVAAVVAAGWVIMATLRLIGRAMGMGSQSPKRPNKLSLASPAAAVVRCPHPKCRAENAESARFCRRCGKVIRLPQAPAVARRVAMW